jgi:hypothetical protein
VNWPVFGPAVPNDAPEAVNDLNAYFLDDRLSLAEGTRRFPADGSGHETLVEGFYVFAIRRSGFRDCLFRFSSRERLAARSMLDTLNREAAAP